MGYRRLKRADSTDIYGHRLKSPLLGTLLPVGSDDHEGMISAYREETPMIIDSLMMIG
jgi:hypothetical protein